MPAKLGPIFRISFLEEFSIAEREPAAGGLWMFRVISSLNGTQMEKMQWVKSSPLWSQWEVWLQTWGSQPSPALFWISLGCSKSFATHCWLNSHSVVEEKGKVGTTFFFFFSIANKNQNHTLTYCISPLPWKQTGNPRSKIFLTCVETDILNPTNQRHPKKQVLWNGVPSRKSKVILSKVHAHFHGCTQKFIWDVVCHHSDSLLWYFSLQCFLEIVFIGRSSLSNFQEVRAVQLRVGWSASSFLMHREGL